MPQKSLFVFVAKSTKCHVADDSRSIGTYKVLNAGGILRVEYDIRRKTQRVQGCAYEK